MPSLDQITETEDATPEEIAEIAAAMNEETFSWEEAEIYFRISDAIEKKKLSREEVEIYFRISDAIENEKLSSPV